MTDEEDCCGGLAWGFLWGAVLLASTGTAFLIAVCIVRALI